VAGDVVAAARGGLDGVRIEFGRAAAAEDGGRHLVALERAQDAPQPFVAAVLRPLDRAAVDRARLQRRGAGEVARAFSVRPALEQDADQDGDALAAGPRGGFVVHCRIPTFEREGHLTRLAQGREGMRGSKPLESLGGTGA